MKKLILVVVCSIFALACASTNNAGDNRIASVNTDVSTNAYTKSENAYTTASNSELGTLTPSGKAAKEIVGKTANEVNIWQLNGITKHLNKLMGSEYGKMRKFWNTETPINKFGDFLMMTGCEQHNCSGNQYVMFLDMGNGNINIIHISKDTIKEWKEFDENTLPPPFAEELTKIKKRQ